MCICVYMCMLKDLHGFELILICFHGFSVGIKGVTNKDEEHHMIYDALGQRPGEFKSLFELN